MSDLLVTVIVPVYKVEQELPKCLDSLLNQTYRNLEILLVDDGSPDQCPEICDAYAKKDSRIKVIHKANGGLSSARNAGLDAMTGQVVTFVDSDDWVADDYVEVLVSNLEKSQADISIVNIAYAWPDGHSTPFHPENVELHEVYNREEAMRELMLQRKFEGIAAAKLFKAELFREVRFPEGVLFEDMPIYLEMIDQCKKVCFTGKAYYYYYQREGSIVNSSFRKAKMIVLDVADNYRTYAREHGGQLNTEAQALYLRIAFMLTMHAISDLDNPEAKEAYSFLIGEMRKYKGDISQNPYIEKRKKMVMKALLMGIPPKAISKMWKSRMENK